MLRECSSFHENANPTIKGFLDNTLELLLRVLTRGVLTVFENLEVEPVSTDMGAFVRTKRRLDPDNILTPGQGIF